MADTPDNSLTVSKADFDPNEVLFSEGDPPTGIFLIEDGTVEVFRRSGGRVVTIARLGRGEVVGELALIEGIPHTRSVRAVTHVTALKVDPKQLERNLAASPTLRAAALASTRSGRVSVAGRKGSVPVASGRAKA